MFKRFKYITISKVYMSIESLIADFYQAFVKKIEILPGE